MNGLQKNAKNLHFWAFWAKMANFGQFLAKMGKTGIFFKKALGTFFRSYFLTNFTQIFYWSPAFRICTGFFRNTNETCLKSVSKTPTFRFFQDFQLFQHPAKIQHPAKWPIFGQFLAKMGKTGFFQKSSWNIFLPLQALSNYKVSEKVMKGFQEKF